MGLLGGKICTFVILLDRAKLPYTGGCTSKIDLFQSVKWKMVFWYRFNLHFYCFKWGWAYLNAPCISLSVNVRFRLPIFIWVVGLFRISLYRFLRKLALVLCYELDFNFFFLILSTSLQESRKMVRKKILNYYLKIFSAT